MKIDDPVAVARQYASEQNLEARRSLYENAVGPDPRELAFAAVAAAVPRRVLEVGGGPGELAARVQDELGCEVVMLDVSPRMVELAAGRGVDARVGDVQELPFPDEWFDVAIAAWMLFHVLDLDRALAELARVLRPSGRLIAVTNSETHLAELRRIAGSAAWEHRFRSEDAADWLAGHFAQVTRTDAAGWITIDDDSTIRSWVRSLDSPPAELGAYELPLRVRRLSSIFVAEKPA